MAHEATPGRDRRDDHVDLRDGSGTSPRSTSTADDSPAVVHRDSASDTRRDRDAAPDRRLDGDYEQRVITKPAKTSAAAAFALVFGTAALVLALTVILSPVALVLALIAIVLGVVGMGKGKKPGVTGKGVAIGGLVLGVLALLLSLAVVAGITTFLNDDSAVERLENQVEQLRDQLPDSVEVPQP